MIEWLVGGIIFLVAVYLLTRQPCSLRKGTRHGMVRSKDGNGVEDDSSDFYY
jgi:hypothetical protein